MSPTSGDGPAAEFDGADLRKRRKLLGKRQSDVAQALVVNSKTISLWERGLTTPPNGYQNRWREVLATWETNAKAESPRDSSHRRFVAWFTERFQRHTGTRPTWGAKQGAQVKRLLSVHGPDELRARAERMFARAGRWPAEHPDLATLVAHIDKFAAEPQRDIQFGWAPAASHEEHAEDARRAGLADLITRDDADHE